MFWTVDPTSESKSKLFFWDVDLGIQSPSCKWGLLDGVTVGKQVQHSMI